MKTIGQAARLLTYSAKAKHQNHSQDHELSKGGCVIIAGFLAVLLSGCATVPLSVKPEEARDIKTVAIVSILEDDFDWIDWALLRWNWKYGTHKVAGWGIDASAEQAARQAIRGMSGYSVVHISEVRGEVLSVTTEEQNKGRKLKKSETAPLLQRLREKYNIDALIVISRGELQHFPLTGRTVVINGNGIAKEITMMNLGPGRIALYSTVTVDVYSTKNSRIIASNQGFRWIHVDQTLFYECVSGKGPTWDGGLKTTVTKMIDAAVCDGIRYTRLIITPESTNASGHTSKQGCHEADCELAKIVTGMTMKEVYDQIGQPAGAVLYYTKNALIPFYAGADQVRFDALYRNEGRITFAGAGPSGFSFRVQEVSHDTNETGYDDQHKHSMPIYSVGRDEGLNRQPN